MQISTESPYIHFDREKWASLRDNEPMTLTADDLAMLKGINEELSTTEVEEIYLPLSRLINLYVNAHSVRQNILLKFLNTPKQKIPFIVGIAGSVSVGKSTVARVLQALLSRQNAHRKVLLITTDGFLYPNKTLEEKGIMLRKGFPESYDIKRLLEFVADVKSGKPEVEAPIYSHLIYDIVPDRVEKIDCPDILILEGLNVLQSGMDYPKEKPRVFVSDYLDFSIYVDAEEELLESWYISRFFKFRKSAFNDPNSYFHSYSKLSENEATKTAQMIWREINRKNLRRNILPTKGRADLILFKSENHSAQYIELRK